MGNSQSRSVSRPYDFNDPPPHAPNPWDEQNRQQKRQKSPSKSPSPPASYISSSTDRSTCSQHKAERRALREQRREERALAREEWAARRRARGGGCCGKKKQKLLTDMYFDSLNSSLGPGPIMRERSVEDVITPGRVIGEEAGFNISPRSHRVSNNAYERSDGDLAGGPSHPSPSRRAAAGAEWGTEEVPPPAYEEAVEQAKQEKR